MFISGNKHLLLQLISMQFMLKLFTGTKLQGNRADLQLLLYESVLVYTDQTYEA